MKRFLEVMISIKNYAAMAFTGMVMCIAVVGWFFGMRSLDFSMIWQFIFIALVCGGLQFIFFSGHVVKTTHYIWRLLGFMPLLFVTVLGFAIVFRWFPIRASSLLIFTAIFLGIFAITSIVFEIYFKIVGQRYTQQLNAYKAGRKD